MLFHLTHRAVIVHTNEMDYHARYQIGPELGRGQSGVVYVCTDSASGARIACKQINVCDTNSSDSPIPREALREAEMLLSVRGCNGVITLHGVHAASSASDAPATTLIAQDIFQDDFPKSTASVRLFLELGAGGSLMSLIERKGRLTEREARRVFREIAIGMKSCHDRGIVHCDIKPDNVLLCPIDLPRRDYGTSDGRPSKRHRAGAHLLHHLGIAAPNVPSFSSAKITAKLADFGAAVRLESGQKLRGHAGSFPYEAPEVVSGRAYDQSADVWSLGVTLYTMLSGEWPSYATALANGYHGDNCSLSSSSSSSSSTFSSGSSSTLSTRSGAERGLDGSVDWQAPCWWLVSRQARNLIRRMVHVDSHMRPTADEILNDPWLAPLAPKHATGKARG